MVKKILLYMMLIVGCVMFGGCNGKSGQKTIPSQETKVVNEVKKLTENGISILNGEIPPYDASFHDMTGDGAYEEFEAMFAEDKSPEETCKIIQNRVWLYIKETE